MKNPLLLATGLYGLVGRGLLESAPDVVPLARGGVPSDLAGFRPALAVPPADITDPKSLAAALAAASRAAAGRSIVVIHLAAMTDTKGGDHGVFDKVNVLGTENVMNAAQAAGASFIHVSTDYVFSGEPEGRAPFRERDRPVREPAGVYAASKFRAENLVLNADLPMTAVARIAFPYGGRGPRQGLDKKMVHRFESARQKNEPVALFDDQTICPSYIGDVARGLLSLAAKLAAGGKLGKVFHLTGEPTTPHAFGVLLRRLAGFEDVAVSAGSVQGMPYAKDLTLVSDETREALGWKPTPHVEALASALKGRS